MKFSRTAVLAVLMFSLAASGALAQSAYYTRDNSDSGKMMHKLGRGVVNVFTCWVEIPRNVAVEWERTDPVSGLGVGLVKGFGWGFARFATGVFETFTFPLPVPADYRVMMEPEFIVTDVWGATLPGIAEFDSNDPNYPDGSPIYPERFRY